MTAVLLGIDTSMGTSVALVRGDGRVLAELADPAVRAHAESIGPLLAELLAGEGQDAALAVEAVAVGMGPGPYTGLRVGIAAATAFALGRGVPLLGVPSHDAIRAELGLAPAIALATPAGRRGHYVSQAGEIVLSHEGIGEAVLAERVSAAAVAQVALARRASGQPTGPSEAIYLRAADVAVPVRRSVGGRGGRT